MSVVPLPTSRRDLACIAPIRHITARTVYPHAMFGTLVCVCICHPVFGKVTKGMEVIKAIEAVGSQSGGTAQPVRVSASGEL